MKKVLTIVSALFIMAGSAFAQSAQTAPTPEARAKNMTAEMSMAVTLSGEQQGKVWNLYTDYYKVVNEADALRATDAKTADAKVATAKAARDKGLKAVLTADQLKAWSADKRSTL
jgi:hypothetical protein